jgi:predicted GTPase
VSAQTVQLSLISHTNVGKTTLARTLVGRDVGEVRDAPHVTELAEGYVLIETPEGDALRLWDTPGFGDSARLAKRLLQSGNPIGWFLSQVWDRFRDRPFWSSQQAIRNVREEADVTLYLVNAAESPRDAAYVEPEMQVLEWIGKPAIVLLNQAGQPRPPDEEEADVARWRQAVGHHRFVHAVLPLDAFARCWVQELVLLRAIGEAVPADKREAFARLAAAWRARRMQQFEASMAALADNLARAACDREVLDEQGMGARLREVGKAMGIPQASTGSSKDRAMRALAERSDAATRETVDQLVRLHGLEGRAAADVLQRMAEDYDVAAPVDEGKAALLGGLVSGALTGLAADLAAGGLTFGAGVLAGGLLGALGSAGLARGFNLVSGKSAAAVRWSDEVLHGLVAASLLRYLAIAHYGRGRGEWRASEYPPFWKEEVAALLEDRRETFDAVWRERGESCEPTRLAALLRGPLEDAALTLLDRLYPGALEAAG